MKRFVSNHKRWDIPLRNSQVTVEHYLPPLATLSFARHTDHTWKCFVCDETIWEVHVNILFVIWWKRSSTCLWIKLNWLIVFVNSSAPFLCAPPVAPDISRNLRPRVEPAQKGRLSSHSSACFRFALALLATSYYMFWYVSLISYIVIFLTINVWLIDNYMERNYRCICGTRNEESSTHVNRVNLICVPAQSEESQVRKKGQTVKENLFSTLK